MRVVDLSFPIGPHSRWRMVSERRSTHEAGANFQATVLTVSCHACTHVDLPVHFLAGDRDIALPLRVTGADGSPVRAIVLLD